jgi:dTDP-4-amino-4,6-dideoxygalactose transaminase
VAFCLVASSVYILNDILDIEEDRKHPSKKARPLASGKVSKKEALSIMVFLAVKDNISWHFPYLSANTTPWQLEGVIQAHRNACYQESVGKQFFHSFKGRGISIPLKKLDLLCFLVFMVRDVPLDFFTRYSIAYGSCEISVLLSNEREALVKYLQSQGVGSGFHYMPLHFSRMGRLFGGKEGDCPVTESVSDRLLRLPFHNMLTGDDWAYLVSKIKEFHAT